MVFNIKEGLLFMGFVWLVGWGAAAGLSPVVRSRCWARSGPKGAPLVALLVPVWLPATSLRATRFNPCRSHSSESLFLIFFSAPCNRPYLIRLSSPKRNMPALQTPGCSPKFAGAFGSWPISPALPPASPQLNTARPKTN